MSPVQKNGIWSAVVLFIVFQREGEIPAVEWWDHYLLPNDSYEGIEDRLTEGNFEGVTHLVEHPIQLKPPSQFLDQLSVSIICRSTCNFHKNLFILNIALVYITPTHYYKTSVPMYIKYLPVTYHLDPLWDSMPSTPLKKCTL